MSGHHGSDAARKSFQVHGPFAGPQHVYPTEKRANTAARKLDAHLPKPGTSEHEFHVKMYGSAAHTVKPATTSKGLDWGMDHPSVAAAEAKHGSYDVFPKRGGTVKLVYHARTKLGDKPAPNVRQHLGVHRNAGAAMAAAEAHHATVTAASRKSLRLVSLDDYYESVVKAEKKARRGADRQEDDGEKTRPKKFPRDLSPTARMKPVSDEDAMSRLRKDGKHSKKSLRWLATLKALATGYGKVSGGGALKAANRGPAMPLLGPSGRRAGKSGGHYRSRSRSSKANFGPDGRPGPKSDKANFGRRPKSSLRRAMEAMSAPAGSAKPPKVYLPGVHNPKSPVRRAPGLKKPKLGGAPKPPAAPKPPPTLAASLRPSTSSERSPRVLDGGGAAELSNSLGVIAAGRRSLVKAEHGFKAGDLVVHNATAGAKDPGVIAAVGGRSTDTHVHIKTATGRPGTMVHHSEVRAAASDDVKYHKKNVAKLKGLGLTKGITR